MLRFPTARAKTGVYFFAEGMLPALVTRPNQLRGVHFAIKSLKSKVKTCSVLCSAGSDVRPSQQCCSTFRSAGNASSLFQRSSFHGFHQFKSLQTKCPSQGLCFHCEFRTAHSANRRALLLLGSVTRHKSDDASQSQNHGKDTVSTSAWQWNRQSKFGSGGHGYVILVTAAVVGTAVAVYILSGYKNRYNSNDSRWQAELESLEKNDGLETPRKVKSLSLEEAIAQATDLCQRVKDESGSPGLVAAVSMDGQLVWTEGLGYADVENRVPCKANTVMRIASISKSLTMAAVAKAMEKGELDLDKPVQFYVPQFPEKIVNGEKVTLTTRHLVSHLGGIRHYSKDYLQKNPKDGVKDNTKDNVKNNTKDNTKSTSKENTKSKSADNAKDSKDNLPSSATAASTPGKKSKPAQDLKVSGEFVLEEYYIKDKFNSTEEALALFRNDPLVHAPGTKYLYTSHGWTLVAAVLEGATKRKFPDLIGDLFRDLGLDNTYLDENHPLIYNRARFYARNTKGLLVNAPYVDCSYKYAGGGMLSTVTDLVRFANAMLYSYQYQSPQSSGDMHQQDGKAASLVQKDEDSMQRKNLTSKPPSAQDPQKSNSYPIAKNPGGCHDSLPGYLTPATMQQIWSPVELTKCSWDKGGFYAMGWAVVPEKQAAGYGGRQRFYVSHTGGAIGASSVLLILPTSSGGEGGKGDNLSSASAPPKGVAVAIIVNMISVSLCKTALRIAKLFEQVSLD